MAFYEVTFIARPDLSRQEVQNLEETFTKTLEKEGGKVVKNEYWGLRSLAYKIKKTGKGHFVMLGIEAEAPALHELERTIRINENVMRQLTVKVDSISDEPSAPIRDQRDAA